LDRRGEVVGRRPVRAQDNHVLELAVRILDASERAVLPGGDTLVRHAKANRPVVLVGLLLRDQAARLLQAAFQPVELEGDRPVPVEAEPGERLLDLARGLLHLPARVRVLDAEAELPAVVSRVEPVEERRADVPDVQIPRWARRHADSDGHRSRLDGCSSEPTAVAGSRARSTAPARSARTRFSSSSRAHARGASPPTTPPTSTASACGAPSRR